MGQQKVVPFRFHNEKRSEWAWQNLLSFMCIRYQFSCVRTRGTWRSGLVTQRTRVAQRTSGAEHSVYRARFSQDRVAAAHICQEGTRQEQTGPRQMQTQQDSIQDRELKADVPDLQWHLNARWKLCQSVAPLSPWSERACTAEHEVL